MLLSLIFLIHSFGLIKGKDLAGSTKYSDTSLLHRVKGLSEGNYYEYRLDKKHNENNYIALRVFTKLKFRDAPANPQKLWSNATVPFVISRKCCRKQKKMILKAMKWYKVETCVRFTPRKNETTFIMITPGKRCGALLGYKKDRSLPVAKGCYKLDTIIQELMSILDFNVEPKKHGGENNSKTFGKDVHLLRISEVTRNNFAKVNRIFGCNIKKSNDPWDRIRGGPREVSAETHRSSRRKRNVLLSNSSSKSLHKRSSVTKCNDHHASMTKVTKNEGTTANVFILSSPTTEVPVENNVTSTDSATDVTTDNNVASTNPSTEVTTDRNGTSTDPAIEVTTDNNVTSTHLATKVNADNNVTLTDPTTEVMTDINVTSTDPATEVTTDNNVTSTDPTTEVTTDNNVTSTDPTTEVTTDNNVTSTDPTTEVTADHNVTSTDPTTEVTTDHNVTSTDPATEVTTNNNGTLANPKTTVGNLVKCEKQIEESVFDESQLMPFHKIDIISSVLPRTSIVDPSRLWGKPEIPYVIAEEKYDSTEKDLIRKAIKQFSDKTCVRFIPRTTEETYISMEPNKRCSARIGKVEGGVNSVSLDIGCFSPGTIQHEMMHTLGFVHEQNRHDRDKHVMVVWDNIVPEARHNYRRYNKGQTTSFGQDYDYGSVMHYGMYDFAINKDRPTLIPLQNGVRIGQRDGFSKKDIFKINKLFNCKIEEEEKNAGTKPSVSVRDFRRKFLDYVAKLFKAVYRTLHRFNAD